MARTGEHKGIGDEVQTQKQHPIQEHQSDDGILNGGQHGISNPDNCMRYCNQSGVWNKPEIPIRRKPARYGFDTG